MLNHGYLSFGQLDPHLFGFLLLGHELVEAGKLAAVFVQAEKTSKMFTNKS